MPQRTLAIIASSLFLFFQSLPVAEAMLDWRSAREHGPRMESCNPYEVLPKRHPGKLASKGGADLYVEEQVANIYGQYVFASSAHTAPLVRGGSTVSARLLVRNASLFDVSEVVINHRFASMQSGLRLDSVRSVVGASYHGERRMFVISAIRSGETAVVSFQMQLSDRVSDEISESVVEIEDFTVVDAAGNAMPTIEKGGLKSIAAICFLSTMAAPSIDTVKKPGIPGASILVQKRAGSPEVLPGGEVSYSISITNQSGQPLSNLRVDDRFNLSQLQVIEAPNALRTGYGLQWIIPVLPSGDRFTARYRVQIPGSVSPGTIIPGTVTVSSADFVGISPSKLSSTSEVRVLGKGSLIPRTGVDLTSFLFLILSSIALASVATRKFLRTCR